MSYWECKDRPRARLEPCGCLPSGFTRLRYFHGKHLTAADFVDEQRYHAGKTFFHNLHLHGAGVLCGLKVTAMEAGETMLRVTRGAALDACGREVVVGFDQCIDVEAWFEAERRRRRDADATSEWPADHVDEDGALRLCVALRYHEGPGHPEPAPRDPCACSEGSCEYGRVNEGFELRLFVDGAPGAPTEPDLFPSRERIEDVLADAVAGVDVVRRLSGPITEGCAHPAEDTSLVLGCVNVRLDEDLEGVEGLDAIAPAPPPVLLSTSVLQYLLGQIYNERVVHVGAPALTDVIWEADDSGGYRMRLLVDHPLDEASVDPDSFGLRKLDQGWDPPGATVVATSYDDGSDGPELVVSVQDSGSFLEDGGRYHLFADRAMPPVTDAQLRPLRPDGFIWAFELSEDPASNEFQMHRL